MTLTNPLFLYLDEHESEGGESDDPVLIPVPTEGCGKDATELPDMDDLAVELSYNWRIVEPVLGVDV